MNTLPITLVCKPTAHAKQQSWNHCLGHKSNGINQECFRQRAFPMRDIFHALRYSAFSDTCAIINKIWFTWKALQAIQISIEFVWKDTLWYLNNVIHADKIQLLLVTFIRFNPTGACVFLRCCDCYRRQKGNRWCFSNKNYWIHLAPSCTVQQI